MALCGDSTLHTHRCNQMEQCHQKQEGKTWFFAHNNPMWRNSASSATAAGAATATALAATSGATAAGAATAATGITNDSETLCCSQLRSAMKIQRGKLELKLVQPELNRGLSGTVSKDKQASARQSSIRTPPCREDSKIASTMWISARPSSPGTRGERLSLMARASLSICRAC